MMELPYWEKACFITLTYDDDHLPSDGSLSTEEMPLFWKRVRKRYSPQKVKSYYCGEYGDEGFRCHYHAIVFGVDFAPWTFVMHKNGRDIFTSDILADLWQHRGFVTVSDVTYDDCAYTAGYVQKKLYGKAADFYVKRNWIPPFAHASHGLSLDYVHDHKDQLLANQFVWSKGHKSPLPRYVSGKLGLLDTDEDGHSPMFYKAQEILKQRREDYLKKHPELDELEGYWSFMRYDSSARRQRELELQSKYGVLPNDV